MTYMPQVRRNIFAERDLTRLRGLVWIYVILLIFEGAVRKWIPPLSVPFLVVRDPVAMLIWFYGARLKVGPARAWTFFYIFFCVITGFAFLQIIGLSLSPLVVLYGWRSYVLHLPVLIVMSAIFTTNDMRNLGRWTLMLSIPMVLLMIAQYSSPADGFLNRGTSGVGGQLMGALGHVRPAGTFSYITGPVEFIPVAVAFLLWGVARRTLFPGWLLLGSAVALLSVQPVSVSRSLVVSTALVLLSAGVGSLLRGGITFRPESLPRIGLMGLLVLVVVAGSLRIPIVKDALVTFTVRWTLAQSENTGDSGLTERVAGTFLSAYSAFSNAPPLGYGMGAGSQVAAAFDNSGTFKFGEGALEREISELGSIVGFCVVMIRLLAGAALLVIGIRAILQGKLLSWLLMPLALTLVVTAGVDQTTIQGFLVVITGLCFSALRLGI